MTAPLLRMVGIAKRFPGVQALQRVDLDLAPEAPLGRSCFIVRRCSYRYMTR